VVGGRAPDGDGRPVAENHRPPVSAAEPTKPRRVMYLAWWDGPVPGVLFITEHTVGFLRADTLEELGPTTIDGVPWDGPRQRGAYGKIVADAASSTFARSEGGRLELFYWERTLHGRVFEFRDPLLEDTAHSDDVEGLAVHPSGAVLATASDTEGKLKLWSLVNGQLLGSVKLSNAHGVA